MSFHSISTTKSPKATLPDSRKIPSSPKPTRLNAKAEYYSMGVIAENKEAAKQTQTVQKKPALEIQLQRPVNDRRAITQSRSPTSLRNADPGSTRFNVLKQYLSPTSAKSGVSTSFAKKEVGRIENKEGSVLDASIEQSVKTNSRLEKPKANSTLTSRTSARTSINANPKPEPTVPSDRLTKKLVKGISPSTTKLRDSSRDFGLNKRASETDRGVVDSPFDLESVKNIKPNTPSASILRKNSKFGFDSNRETNSRMKNSIADPNTARSSKRYASPYASSTNIHKKTPSDVSHEANTSKTHQQRQPGTASSATIRRSVRISEEDLGLSGLNAINEAAGDGNKDDQNGSCSRERSREPEKTTSESPPKYKKLNLIIPTVQINAGDLHEGTKSAKHSMSTMRSMFYNLNHSIIEESPTHTENKSARLFSSTNIEEKEKEKLNPTPTPTPAPAEENQKMYPSRNSDFNFQMRYFKPIEEAKLEEFINDSKKANDELSNNITALISKSPEKRDKSSLHLPRSQVSTPKIRNSSPSMAQLLGTTREKSAKRNPPQANSRGLSPQPLVKVATPAKSRENSDQQLFKTNTNDKRPEINTYPSALDPKVRLRSPIRKWEQVTPRSPQRSGASSGSHTLRNSIDTKEAPSSSFVRSSFSRQHQNSKLAEEMESLPVVIDLEGKESKKKNEQSHITDDRFSNLDKLLAQLRSNPLKQMEFSLADTEDSEKGLFNAGNDEANDSKNSECQVNKSFARNLMKFSSNN